MQMGRMERESETVASLEGEMKEGHETEKQNIMIRCSMMNHVHEIPNGPSPFPSTSLDTEGKSHFTAQ